MAFTFKSNCLITSQEFSNLVYGNDDGSTNLTAVEKAMVEFIVNSVNDKLLKYLDRNIIQANYSEIRDTNGSDMILTKEYPIVSVSSLKIADKPSEFATTDPLASTEYNVNDNFITLYEVPYTKGRSKIKIDYTAGYLQANVPSDLKFALIIQYKLDNKLMNPGETSADSAIYTSGTSKMGESFSANKTYNEKGLAKEVVQILDNHKRLETADVDMFVRVF